MYSPIGDILFFPTTSIARFLVCPGRAALAPLKTSLVAPPSSNSPSKASALTAAGPRSSVLTTPAAAAASAATSSLVLPCAFKRCMQRADVKRCRWSLHSVVMEDLSDRSRPDHWVDTYVQIVHPTDQRASKPCIACTGVERCRCLVSAVVVRTR